MSIEDPTAYELHLADQIDAVWRTDKRQFSAGVYGALLMRTRERVRAEPIAYSVGVPGDYELANCGRGRMPIREGGYSTAELRAATVRDAETRGVTRQQFAEQVDNYDIAINVAFEGGSPVRTVILRRGDGRLEYVVPEVFWSPFRVAEIACHQTEIVHCAFCGRESATPLDTFLLDDCGGVLYVLAACSRCEQTVEDQAGDARVDWLRIWDDWSQVVGWPDDQYR